MKRNANICSMCKHYEMLTLSSVESMTTVQCKLEQDSYNHKEFQKRQLPDNCSMLVTYNELQTDDLMNQFSNYVLAVDVLSSTIKEVDRLQAQIKRHNENIRKFKNLETFSKLLHKQNLMMKLQNI